MAFCLEMSKVVKWLKFKHTYRVVSSFLKHLFSHFSVPRLNSSCPRKSLQAWNISRVWVSFIGILQQGKTIFYTSFFPDLKIMYQYISKDLGSQRYFARKKGRGRKLKHFEIRKKSFLGFCFKKKKFAKLSLFEERFSSSFGEFFWREENEGGWRLEIGAFAFVKWCLNLIENVLSCLKVLECFLFLPKFLEG